MAWDEATNSTAVFRYWLAQTLAPDSVMAGAWNDFDRYRLACFDATVTPDRNATDIGRRYGSGTWIVGAEVRDTSGGNHWNTGGLPIRTLVQGMPDGLGLSIGPVTVGPVTMLGAAGDLQFDVKGVPQTQGAAYHYWGGITDVTLGSLTITWKDNLLIKFTMGPPPPPPPPPPTVTAVTPASGEEMGAAVVVTGTDLLGASAVRFAGQLASAVVVVDATTINCWTPPQAAGAPVDVSVTTPGGTGTGPGLFTYVVP
jgi:hypothetical protein